ncbi:hypothetical protein N431DRAFT_296842, partial [Stipitochalara longipes BDJ]
WAILIGINFYEKKPLKGCVRDVEKIKQYLETGLIPVSIEAFTATGDPSTSRHPIERQELWPTYENIVSCIKRITAKGKPGDCIYLHFSGHGTKLLSNFDLVLFDELHGIRYLPGLEFAHLLKQIVEKGLLVTVVLDCCFSGGVVRHHDSDGGGIRAIDYDPIIAAAYPPKLYTEIHLPGNSPDPRNASILPQWLVDPQGYTILTACQPHEIAQELKIDGERSGALSYFLVHALTALRRAGIEITHRSLYQHLRINFHASWPKQHPMRYGNGNFTFFGKMMSKSDSDFIPVFRAEKDNGLCLGAGYAHGVSEGDEFAVYPLHAPEDAFNDSKYISMNFRVGNIRGLTSDLIETQPRTKTIQVQTGWKAKPVTHLSPQKALVRIFDQAGDISLWIETAKNKRFVPISAESAKDRPCLFSVTCNDQNEYEILDCSHQRIMSLPTISRYRKRALSTTVDILEHLATFKYIEGIENRIPNLLFEKGISIRLSDASQEISDASLFLHPKHNGEVTFVAENTSDMPIYVHMYNLGPLWQIENLIDDDGGGDYKELYPKNERERQSGLMKRTFEMTVPKCFLARGQDSCEDILKVFITNNPTSFSALTMGRIPSFVEEIETGRTDYYNHYNHMSEFLAKLATPSRGSVDNNVSDELWTTRTFFIHT